MLEAADSRATVAGTITFKNYRGREPGTLPKAANSAVRSSKCEEEEGEEEEGRREPANNTSRRAVRARDGAPRFLASSRSSLASRAKSFHFHRDQGNAYLRSAPRTKALRRGGGGGGGGLSMTRGFDKKIGYS